MTQITHDQAAAQNTDRNDQLTTAKTIYDASAFEIFWRNLLSGMARAFGGLLVYTVFLAILAYLFTTIIYPSLKPLLDNYTNALDAINQLNNRAPQTPTNLRPTR